MKTSKIKRTKSNINLNSLYDEQLNNTIFTTPTLNLPKKDFSRSRIKKKNRTFKTPVSPIHEASDEDSKGGKKIKKRKRYTRKRKN